MYRLCIARKQLNSETVFEYVDAARNIAQNIEVTETSERYVWILSVIINGLCD